MGRGEHSLERRDPQKSSLQYGGKERLLGGKLKGFKGYARRRVGTNRRKREDVGTIVLHQKRKGRFRLEKERENLREGNRGAHSF